MAAINRAIRAEKGKIRVALVKKISSAYELAENSPAGAPQIKVTAPSVLTGDTALKFGSEYVQFTGQTKDPLGTKVDVQVVTQNPTTGAWEPKKDQNGQPFPLPAHKKGDFIEFPAAAWGSDPIVIAVEDSSIDIIKATILHEVGHSIPPGGRFQLKDVRDAAPTKNATSIMHEQQGGKANCLRYLPRPLAYDNPAGSKEENQWEKIQRP